MASVVFGNGSGHRDDEVGGHPGVDQLSKVGTRAEPAPGVQAKAAFQGSLGSRPFERMPALAVDSGLSARAVAACNADLVLSGKIALLALQLVVIGKCQDRVAHVAHLVGVDALQRARDDVAGHIAAGVRRVEAKGIERLQHAGEVFEGANETGASVVW